jgi:hypothetical protein
MQRVELTPRERVQLALFHLESDRVPVDFMATPEAPARLSEHLGINDQETILYFLGIDMRHPRQSYIGPPPTHSSDGSWVDAWGVRYRQVEHNGGAYDDDVTGITPASQYGRYGYWRITALLKQAGWRVGKDRVERFRRREGLKVPKKQKPRRRLWLNDGSCVRLRPERPRHVWSYDFVSAATHDGRSLRLLTLIDEDTREYLAIRVARRLGEVRK